MVKSDFSSCISKYSGSVQNDASLEGNWNVLKGALLKATNRSCGWTKDPTRNRETWWWYSDICNGVNEKGKIWKE